MGVWRRRRNREGSGASGEARAAIPPRSDPTTVTESVQLIASMKGLDRFAKRERGDEAPREVFQDAADAIGREFAEGGWRYARSGPHLSRTDRDVRFVFHFGSDTLNVSGQLVAFYVRFTIHDRGMAAWRESESLPIGRDALVARSQIGALFPNPSATQWNLAASRERVGTIADIKATIRDHGLGFAATAFDVLGQQAPATSALRPLVDDLELVEYLIRFGRQQEAHEVVRSYILGLSYSPRRRWFLDQTRQLWEEGLSPLPDFAGIHSPRDALTWSKLPYLIVRYRLATESEMSAWANAAQG